MSRTKTTAESGLLEQLKDYSAHSRELGEGLHTVVGRRPSQRSTAKRNGGGRKSNSVSGAALLSEAPFPELVTLPAGKLRALIREIDDVVLLQRAHSFEGHNKRRQTVFVWIEERLRALGAPLGGPKAAPIRGYDSLDEHQLVEKVEDIDADAAARVYAYEWYHLRRRSVLDAAERLCGMRGVELVQELEPWRGQASLPAPFAGYEQLSTSPQARLKLRTALDRQDKETLEKAVAYELATRRRETMLDALRVALNRKSR